MRANQYLKDPRQQTFVENYYDKNSSTFGNCYKSAISAGYSENTAKQLTSNRPKWLFEKPRNLNIKNQDELLVELSNLIDAEIRPSDKIKAIELLMKYHGLLVDRKQVTQLNIDSVLEQLE